jgi:hypothetical protein
MNGRWRVPRPGTWDLATLVVLGAMLLFTLLTFDQHAISNDEPVQHRYGRLLLDYYASGFSDLRAFQYINLFHYGGLFDMLAAWLEPRVPLDVWDLRHLLTGLTGVAGLGGAAWLARNLGSPRAGCFAILLLALAGAWTGVMFTHTKDVPFAAATLWSIACSTRLLQRLPRPGYGIICCTGVAMGAALGLRYGGILLPGYLGLCLLLALFQGLPGRSLLRLWPLPVIMLAMMGVFWPWSVTGWDHFLVTARAFSRYDLELRTLVDGVYVPANQIPTSYLFDYFARTLPELFLWGIAFSAVLGVVRLFRSRPGAARLLYLAPLLLSLAVPAAIVLLTRPALYNGTRHFTFLLPSLAVFAALGLDRYFARLQGRPVLQWAHAALLVLLAGDAAAQLVRLHPYQYVAYNRLSGGLPAAYGRWETDYWSDGLREAAAGLNAWVAQEPAGDPGRRYRVAVCAEPIQAMHYLDPRFIATRDWPTADFFLASTSTRCDRALEGKIVAQVRRDGIPLVVVKDRRALAEHQRGVRGDDEDEPGN